MLFTVRGTGCEKNDLIDVRGKPVPAMKKLFEKGKDLWWQGENIYITIFETGDVKIPKVGYSHNHRFLPIPLEQKKAPT